MYKTAKFPIIKKSRELKIKEIKENLKRAKYTLSLGCWYVGYENNLKRYIKEYKEQLKCLFNQ